MSLEYNIAAAVAANLDYHHLADLIAERLQAKAQESETPVIIEVAEIRNKLGHRGQPMATLTFEKHFIKSGKISYVPGPDGRKRYVLREEWQRVFGEVKKVGARTHIMQQAS